MTEWQSIIGTGVIQNSYGSFVRSGRKPPEPLMQHFIEPADTLAGISLKYGSTMEDLRRINKLHYTDSIQSRKFLLIPSSGESAGGQDIASNMNSQVKSAVASHTQENPQKAHPSPKHVVEEKPVEKETSVHDFLKKVDMQISSTKQNASSMLSENYEIPPETRTSTARFMKRKPSLENSTETTFSSSKSIQNSNDDLFQL